MAFIVDVKANYLYSAAHIQECKILINVQCLSRMPYRSDV